MARSKSTPKKRQFSKGNHPNMLHVFRLVVGEHMIKFHPEISGTFFTYMFLPFPNFLLKSRVVLGNNDQDHLYNMYFAEGLQEDFLRSQATWTESELYQVGVGNCMKFQLRFFFKRTTTRQ